MKSSFIHRVLLVPSAVFLSVMFGGAYGSGREVVQFISLNGPIGGYLSILTIFCVYASVLFMCFELARMFKVYEYQGLMQILLKRGWVLYEVLIIIGLVVTMAICATTAGAIASDHFGISAILGGAILLALIVGLNFYGRDVVEKSMILCVIALALALIFLVISTFSEFGSEISGAFQSAANPSVAAVKTGLTQSLTSSGFIPILLFCAISLKSRSEVAIAAIFAAFLTVLPAVAMHTSFMAGYPEILDETVPAYWLVEKSTFPAFLNVYIAIVFVMVAQTGVGMLHGVIERIDSFMVERRGKPLRPIGHGLVAGSAYGISLMFSSIGLTALIIKSFTFFSISFLIVFFIPLFTYGAWLVLGQKNSLETGDQNA